MKSTLREAAGEIFWRSAGGATVPGWLWSRAAPPAAVRALNSCCICSRAVSNMLGTSLLIAMPAVFRIEGCTEPLSRPYATPAQAECPIRFVSSPYHLAHATVEYRWSTVIIFAESVHLRTPRGRVSFRAHLRGGSSDMQSQEL